MRVASIELCEELYNLSQWGKEVDGLSAFDKETGEIYQTMNVIEDGDGYLRESFVPAYDLGYLLRKLPNGPCIVKQDMDLALTMGLSNTASNMSFYLQLVVFRLPDTNQKTLSVLFIELFKQGV